MSSTNFLFENSETEKEQIIGQALETVAGRKALAMSLFCVLSLSNGNFGQLIRGCKLRPSTEKHVRKYWEEQGLNWAKRIWF